MPATDENRVLDRSKRSRVRNNMLKNRRRALKKKAYELATLCDMKLCLVSYGPQGGEPEIWPENKSEVEEILTRFLQLSEADRAKKSSNPSKFSRMLKEDPGTSARPDYYTWCPQLEKCSEKKLWELNDDLNAKLQILNKKIDQLSRKRPIDDNEMVNLFPSSNGGCHSNREGSMVPYSHVVNTNQIQQSAIPLKHVDEGGNLQSAIPLRQLSYKSSTCLDEDAIDCNLRLGPSAN